MAEEQKYKIDLKTSDKLTPILLRLLNSYPDLDPGERIIFADGSQEQGIYMITICSAVIVNEYHDIVGNYQKDCQYPFYISYAVGKDSTGSRVSIKEFLDDLGIWLEGQDLSEMLTVSEEAKLERQTPAFLEDVSEAGIERWSIYINLFYTVVTRGEGK